MNQKVPDPTAVLKAFADKHNFTIGSHERLDKRKRYNISYGLDDKEQLVSLVLVLGPEPRPNLVNSLLNELQAPDLERLRINNAELTSLNVLKQFSNLRELSLQSTSLTDLTTIGSLSKLEYLECRHSSLRSLRGIESLPALQFINLSYTDISSLEPLATLENLRNISLFGTRVNDLSPLASLQNLHRIYLSSSEVGDLSCLTEFPNLTRVVAENCNITQLPASLLQLNLDIVTEPFDVSPGKKEINVADNPIVFPPLEIVARGNAVMQKYYDSLQGDTGKLNEAKLILVGEGAAGKTSLIKRFIDGDFNPQEDKTDGISIRAWQVTSQEEDSNQQSENIKVHCWDFGGQEIMRATHQLFLSERSVYLVVLNIRKDDNPEHWLKQVMAVSSKSPIIVVLNKCDEHYDDNLTRQFLKEKYPNIVGFFKVSCQSNEGIDALQQEVIKQVSQLDMRKFVLAQNWLDIKQSLESLKKDKDYIGYDRFIQVCEEKGISDPVVQDILLTLLHDLGLVIHFKQLQELQTQVLNPSWITEGIYTLINADELAKQNGVLSKSKAESILNQKYPCNKYSGKTAYLMQVMQQFELCYEIPKVQPISDAHYLIPDLLPTELSENPTLEKGIELIYKYDGYMPPELMARFIVKSHRLQEENRAWRYGVFLRSDEFNSSALVTVDKEDRKIRINVNSGEQRSFMAVIRNYFADIHRAYQTENIGLQEYVSLKQDDRESLIEYSRLIKLEQRYWQGSEKDTQYDHKLDVEYSVTDLLNGFETIQARKKSFKNAPDNKETTVIHNHVTANPNITQNNQQSNDQSNTQSTSQRTTVSISIQLQTFCSTLKDWSEETLEDLAESPDIQKDAALQALVPRAKKEITRIAPAIEEMSQVENQEQAQGKVDKFAKVQSFIKDAIEGTNKMGELINKAGEGIGKLQSMGKEYNNIALKFGLQPIPGILLGSDDSD